MSAPSLPKPETREIASIVGYGRDITRAYMGPLLDPQDSVLEQKRFDYQVYEAILRDDQVASCFQQFRSAVKSREWDVAAGGDRRQDRQAAEFIRKTLERIRWDNVTDKMLFGVFYGFAIGELIWEADGGQVQLVEIKVRKQRRFRFGWDMQPRLMTFQNMLEGEVLPDYKFWHYSTGADNDDEPYGLGLGHWLYWLTYFKRNGIKSWLKFLERFALPTAKGTYSQGTTADERQKLKLALQGFGEDAAMMIPESVAIELVEASRTGTADYSVLCDRMDAAIAKVILSQTMTTDNGSSLSQAQVHGGVKAEVVKAAADLIDSSANRTWVRWLIDWNFPGAAYPIVSRKMDEEEDLNTRSTRDKTLTDMGFRLTAEKVAEVYGEGYYDPSQIKEDAVDKPPLVSVLGVGGTTALVGFLTQINQLGLSRENAIATLTAVFGIAAADAELMIPEEAAPEPSGLDQLFGGGTETQPTDPALPEAPPVPPSEPAFSESAKLAVLEILDQAIEVSMIQYSETVTDEAIERAIGRRLLALMSVEFAEKKCNPAKSHLCIGKTGKGSCVSLTKKCKVPVTGAAREASDYAAEKADIPDVQKETIAAQVDAAKAPEPEKPKSIDDRIIGVISESTGVSSSDLKKTDRTLMQPLSILQKEEAKNLAITALNPKKNDDQALRFEQEGLLYQIHKDDFSKPQDRVDAISRYAILGQALAIVDEADGGQSKDKYLSNRLEDVRSQIFLNQRTKNNRLTKKPSRKNEPT